MMANAWRDPAWRGAFLLLGRMTATNGDCAIPTPPDGTPKAHLNPFANADCSSTFNLGAPPRRRPTRGRCWTTSVAGAICPAIMWTRSPSTPCIPIRPRGLEHGLVRSTFDPTSDNGTGVAFATVEALLRNTESGKAGIVCEVCHTYVESRHTPYHNFPKSGTRVCPGAGQGSPRDTGGSLAAGHPPRPRCDPARPGLGGGVRLVSPLSPRPQHVPERFGPLTSSNPVRHPTLCQPGLPAGRACQQGKFSLHKGYYHVMLERAEFCSACHDVTNPLTIKNQHGKWVGGFPIERTYTEWLTSRYADRPGNPYFDPTFQARLPDVPYAAGLWPAWDRPDALYRPGPCRPADRQGLAWRDRAARRLFAPLHWGQ